MSDFVNGVCFASAAPGYDKATSDVLNVLPLWKQLEYFKGYQERLRNYLGVQKADWMLREAVYMTSLGTNDYLENCYVSPPRSSQYKIGEYADFLAGIAKNFVKEIYNLGARKI
ncbi:Lipase, GDSL [Cinnamomum micranthum f. kanehirae]|uniref:Lipase, GDSL n=1 Tax=Cinnamomum micranthum f. kanehirae TaxID=337451 RepID=A0A3S3MAU0_9MAGN|nr:Lipase, GDSL [Cinnamomum micranthum f. kanehirae]